MLFCNCGFDRSISVIVAGKNAAAAGRDAGVSDAATALIEGKISKTLKKMLKKQ